MKYYDVFNGWKGAYRQDNEWQRSTEEYQGLARIHSEHERDYLVRFQVGARAMCSYLQIDTDHQLERRRDRCRVPTRW